MKELRYVMEQGMNYIQRFIEDTAPRDPDKLFKSKVVSDEPAAKIDNHVHFKWDTTRGRRGSSFFDTIPQELKDDSRLYPTNDAKEAASLVDEVRRSVREAKRGASTAPPETTKRGPSRLRVSLSRTMTVAEIEYINYQLRKLPDRHTMGFLASGGRTSTMVDLPFWVRLSRNGKLYAESNTLDSRELYRAVKTWLEDTFVNVFPTAVRTFRELS